MFSFQKIVFPIFLFFLSCQSPKSENAQEIIQKALHQSGFDKSSFSVDFDFRDYHYTLIRKPSFYSFSRSTIQKDVEVKDVMTSSKPLQRFIDGKMILLSDSLQRVYSNSLNSVMYFFQLPKPLQDTAAINELVGAVVIHGETYWTLKVTFKEEGGGEDFQDEYRYWINQKNHEIDYLAYNYLTDGGGTRFRRAVNKRKIEGIFFQDYVNYKPFQKFEQLDSLPSLFEQEELQQVSLIENKNIRVVK
ncbi:deoxyribose-phosphate aldolase [Flavobacteriaceae bacterium]|jgi:hypothetical protein|nr:deoxyribose-phosphate aldolase [Flavobacteriaceae bacterium]MDC0874690.1 deoxyribose-phosphate aldolase [Flavobacteriaceae bacterium]MDC1056142.1 deoxyribose-phosphate aldolase [Flavobacteriaceae bacterium]